MLVPVVPGIGHHLACTARSGSTHLQPTQMGLKQSWHGTQSSLTQLPSTLTPSGRALTSLQVKSCTVQHHVGADPHARHFPTGPCGSSRKASDLQTRPHSAADRKLFRVQGSGLG